LKPLELATVVSLSSHFYQSKVWIQLAYLRDYDPIDQPSLCGIDLDVLQRHCVLAGLLSFWHHRRGLVLNIRFSLKGLT